MKHGYCKHKGHIVEEGCVSLQALNKKEHKGCESPEPEHEQYMLGPRCDDKYGRINEEYARVMQQNSIRVSLIAFISILPRDFSFFKGLFSFEIDSCV